MDKWERIYKHPLLNYLKHFEATHGKDPAPIDIWDAAHAAGMKKQRDRIQAIVDQQAEDEGLWFMAQTAPEAYLQEQLRLLHRVIEGQGQESEGK